MHKDAKSCVKSLRGSTQAQLTNDPLQTSNWRLHRQHHEFVVQKSTNEATSTGKSLSEALLFAEHGENILCTKVF